MKLGPQYIKMREPVCEGKGPGIEPSCEHEVNITRTFLPLLHISIPFSYVLNVLRPTQEYFTSNAGYEFFLQCWLHLSPFKTPKKAFYYLNKP
jgi:hypothetical protein